MFQREPINVYCYKPFYPFSKAIGYYDGEAIWINLRKMEVMGLNDLVGLFLHEYAHYCGYKHGNNYKSKDKLFKVPTYGKIFKIIDFGRSIFSINDSLFVSDDFRDENDAATQYTFPPLIVDSDREIVLPNPSFDLTRLAISIFETLFPEKPEDKKAGKVLSSEAGRIVKETKSELYNLLWSWLIDTEGNNILWDSENDERFPDFELYVHISAKCRNAIPKEQITKKAFQPFFVNAVPKNATVYSLFV
jgi:hypothetical protein